LAHGRPDEKAEYIVLTLLFILLITMVSLIVVLWAGTFFFQGYIYTEPSPGIFWQAPAAALLLTVGYAVWCMSIAFSTGASKTNIPINTIFTFTATEDMRPSPAPKIWAIKNTGKKEGEKDGERVVYTLFKDFDGFNQIFQYKDPQGRRWQGRDVIALEIEVEGNAEEKAKMRFDRVDSDVEDYRLFRSSDGWTIQEWNIDGRPTGLPVRFRMTRLLLNLFFNIAHFAAWFIGLWVILRFQWTHALGFAAVMWLVVTLAILPMMLSFSAEVSQGR